MLVCMNFRILSSIFKEEVSLMTEGGLKLDKKNFKSQEAAFKDKQVVYLILYEDDLQIRRRS